MIEYSEDIQETFILQTWKRIKKCLLKTQVAVSKNAFPNVGVVCGLDAVPTLPF